MDKSLQMLEKCWLTFMSWSSLSCRSLCHIHTVQRGPDVPGLGHPGSLYLLFVRSVILCSLVPPVISSSTVFSVCWWQFLLKGRASSWVYPVFAQSFLSRQPPYFHVIADLKILLSLYVMCYYRGKHVYLFQTAQNSCFKCLAHTITSECVLSEHMRDVPWNIWVTEETELSLKVILLMQEALHFLEYAARIWRP